MFIVQDIMGHCGGDGGDNDVAEEEKGQDNEVIFSYLNYYCSLHNYYDYYVILCSVRILFCPVDCGGWMDGWAGATLSDVDSRCC